MDAAVIELDSLTDAIGAATENHDFLFLGRLYFVIPAIVGRIIIWRVSFEFRRAGIDEAIAGHEAKLLALGTNSVLGRSRQMGNLTVGKAERFGPDQQFRIHSGQLSAQK